MANKELNDLRKSDWQEIAKKQGVKFEQKNTVRYLVEKVAEIIGVDDKIVDISDLKKAVYHKLVEIESANTDESNNNENTSETENISEENKEDITKLSQEQIDVMEKTHYVTQATALGVNFGFQQSAKDIKALLDHHVKQNPHVKYEPFTIEGAIEKEANVKEAPVNNELEDLQAQCKELGLAFGSAHTASDLKQLISAVKGASAINVNPNITSPASEPQKTTPFAPVTGGHNQIGQQTAPVPAFLQGNNQPVQNSPKAIQNSPIAHASDVSEVDEEQLKGYRGAIMTAIKSHFRAMTRQEIVQALNQSKYPFTWEINNNPENAMKIEIVLTSKGKSVRLPNENKTDWIIIGG